MERTRKSFILRRLQIAVLLVVSLLTGQALAAEKIAIVSIKPSDQLFSDVDYLLNASGLQGLGQFFLPQVKAYFQGLNGQQPIGVVVMADESGVRPLGFLPVTDLTGFLQRIQEQVGEPIDAGDGIFELQGPQPLFVKEAGGWAFLGQTKESLADLPAAPAQLLEGLDQRYDVAMRGFLKNIPDAYKQMAIAQVREGLERGLADSDDPDNRKMAEAQVAQLTQLIQETDTITVGWQIDPAGKRTHFDLLVKPLAGTKISEQLEANRDTKTEFGGFLVQGAGVQANMMSVLTAGQIGETAMSVEAFKQSTLAQIEKDGDLDNRTRAAAKQLIDTFFTIAKDTVETGKLDSCGSLILKPKALTLISGSHVADGSAIDSAVKQLVEMAKNESEFSFSNVKMNAAEHAGIRFHTLTVPIPAEEYVSKVLGNSMEIVVGVGESSAYLALGNDGLELLKKAIDDSASGAQSVEPFHFEISLLPVLEFAQSVEDNPIVDAVAQMVAGADGKDHIRIRTNIGDEGLLYQLEIEEGVLKLLGQAGQLMTMGGGF